MMQAYNVSNGSIDLGKFSLVWLVLVRTLPVKNAWAQPMPRLTSLNIQDSTKCAATARAFTRSVPNNGGRSF